ncbi:hypothetical protein SAMN05216559_1637 [Halomicrobium zhouii]|uniref:Uncharacterized protein n=1 Tax=Halomicrobium zhouii TaxID=767519 RepID=A0A1I6KZB4_9EURY|nr:hypothetical protein [Halomicrobium zhouii]SFR96544.1 hypothetical protein SAMN05216559_1637 [Halomicrobium zhouii]
MPADQRSDDSQSPSRRSTLQALGTLLAAGGVTGAVAAQEDDGSYRISQADQTVAVEPLTGDRPVEELYSYRLPDQYEGVGVHDVAGGPYYESAGTRGIQQESTTITFLYDGSEGLSLVTVHGKATTTSDGSESGNGGSADGESGGGGSVTWDVAVDAADADWLVRDDQYWDRETGERAASNFDNWDVDGDHHRIDWTWSGEATDGGVLGYLDDASALVIDPSYNEQATLYEEHYAGDVADWQFLSGDDDDLDRFALALDEPLGVAGPDGDLSGVSVDDAQQDDGDGATETESTRTDTETESPERDTDETEEPDETEETEQTEETEETEEPEETEERDGDNDERDDDVDDERDDEDDDDDDDVDDEEAQELLEEKREQIQALREEIQERQAAIADAAGDGPAELREEIEELRERIEEIREELEDDRGSFFERDDRPGRGLGRGNGNGAGRGEQRGPPDHANGNGPGGNGNRPGGNGNGPRRGR